MKKAFLIHGFNGFPNSAWLPWLMKELKSRDIYAASLAMPTPDMPKKIEWIKEIERHIDNSKTEEICLVGHSLGCAAILNYLQSENSKDVKGIVLVSGRFLKSSNILTQEFYEYFDFKKIKSKVKNIFIIHGDKDNFVNVENAYLLGEKLDVEPIIIKDAGHFTTGEGYLELRECLESLIKIIG